MGSGDEGGQPGDAARLADVEKRNAKRTARREAKKLAAARATFKKKVEGEQTTKKKAREKQSIANYFNSSRNPSNVWPLNMVPDQPGAEPHSSNSNGRSSESAGVSIDTVTPSDSSGDTIVLSAKSPMIPIASDSDNAGSMDNADLVEIPMGDEALSSEEEVESPPKKKKKGTKSLKSEKQKRYDRHRKFQTEWSAKLPWAEGILTDDGILHLVRCRVCSAVGKKPCVMAPKSDTLFKHDGRRTAKKDIPKYGVKVGESYMALDCKHMQNLKVYAARPQSTILEAVNHSTSMEAVRKRVQFATIFQVLSGGRPMLEYEARHALYKFIRVPNCPTQHWCDGSGWQIAEYMYAELQLTMKKLVQEARYIAVMVDEVTTVDNGSWLSVHCYVVKNWIRIPLLISLQRVTTAANSNNITTLIMDSVMSGGGLDRPMLARKLLCFGADGAATLQGCHNGVTVQIQQNYAPFAVGMHCVAHRCNLTFKALSKHGVFVAIEKVLAAAHTYFSKSPKRYLEFKKLAELTETKGLKMLKSVETRWVSLIEPMRRLLAEYRTLMYKLYREEELKDITLVSFHHASSFYSHCFFCQSSFCVWFRF